MKTFTQTELEEILRLHKLWLHYEDGGQRANLSYADLSSADLRYSDLSSADLRYSDLSYSYLSSADLRYSIFNKTLLKYSENKTYSPINITSLKYFVTIFKDEINWGCRTFKNIDDIKSFTFDMCSEKWNEEQFNMDKEIIINTATLYQKYWAKN